MIANLVRTLFLGDLEAQYKICRQELEQQLLPTVDKIYSLGNLISCSTKASDRKDLGRNEIVLTFWDKISVEKVRLIGPNEILALNFPKEWTNNASNAFLRTGWLSEKPTMLAAATDKGRLLTHGGLTYGLWVQLGRPETAEEAAKLINERYLQTLNQGSCFKLDRVPSLEANPIWADPVLELYPSWVLAPEPCPFDQVHGGKSLNTLYGRAAASYETHPISYMDSLSYRKFGSLAVIKGAVFRAIDLDLSHGIIASIPKDKAFYLESS